MYKRAELAGAAAPMFVVVPIHHVTTFLREGASRPSVLEVRSNSTMVSDVESFIACYVRRFSRLHVVGRKNPI